MLRRAQITGVLVTALLACAAPAGAASPVSDQYQSAAPPLIAGKDKSVKAKGGSTPTAQQPASGAAAPAPSGRPPTPGASAATPPQRAGAPDPLRVSRNGDANVKQPLSSSGSTLPLIAIGALAALALGLAVAALARGRRSPATP